MPMPEDTAITSCKSGINPCGHYRVIDVTDRQTAFQLYIVERLYCIVDRFVNTDREYKKAKPIHSIPTKIHSYVYTE